jgi:hypothetical protein
MERIMYPEDKKFVQYKNTNNQVSRNHDLPAIIYKVAKYMNWHKNDVMSRNIVFPHKKTFCLHYPHIIYISGEKEYSSEYQKRMILYQNGYLAGKSV